MESDVELAARVAASVANKEAASQQAAERRRLQSVIVTDKHAAGKHDGDMIVRAALELLEGEQPNGRRSVYPSRELEGPVTILVYPRPHEGTQPLRYELSADVRLTLFAAGSIELKCSAGSLTLKRVDGGVKVDRRYLNPVRSRASTGSPLAASRRNVAVRGRRC